MNQIIDFCGRLSANNNREWFNAHKAEYLECKTLFEAFVEKAIVGLRQTDDSIGNLGVADCTYRIYRDIRFSANKAPYKTHFGAFIAPGGKKSGYSGYYFQLGVPEPGYDNGCFLATGNYYVDPLVLRILREDIDADIDNELGAAIAQAEGFRLDTWQSLKRVPKGYPADHPRADMLKLRNYCLLKTVEPAFYEGDDAIERLCREFGTTSSFLSLINRAINFARQTP